MHERERLLREGRGLVTPLGFLLAPIAASGPPAGCLGAGLIVYDLLAMKWDHRDYDAPEMHELCPPCARKT